MGDKTTYFDLPRKPQEMSGRLGLPSPRIQHYDGDIPPALSPLDAFAAHSRALAKQLDDEQRQGRRVSRLPPSLVKRSLSIQSAERPKFLRSHSGGELSVATSTPDPESVVHSPVTEEPSFRPVSIHPRLSSASYEAGDDEHFMTPMEDSPTTQPVQEPTHQPDYFVMPRSSSPEAASPAQPAKEEQILAPPTVQPIEPPRPNIPLPMKKTSADSGVYQRSNPSPGLQPQQLISPRRPNPMRLHHESSDDDYTSSNADSMFSESRKLSSSSGLSAPHSPISPFVTSHQRSPSDHSEVSVGGTRLPRPAFNFSRPLSSASLQMQAEALARRSQDNVRSTMLSDLEGPCASYSMDDARSVNSDGYLSGTGTYTHAKYSLPRGRMVSRNSLVFQGLSTPHFEWQEPLFQPDGSPTARSSPSITPQPTGQPDFSFGFDAPRPKTPENPTLARPAASPAPSSHSTASVTTSRPSEERGRPSVERGDLRAMRGRTPRASTEDDTSSRSDSTVRPQSFRTGVSTYSYMSPDDHLSKAIECHEKGSLKESTYHLRLAATQNHPTAMLLYALACRHGWGIRPNQREGVQWLRKAADFASLEIAEDEGESARGRGPRDLMGMKARKAQFALSIYELGVSHLNGWGIEQDRALALRCFEIAGNWGDGDALAEAGYCYAEGIGCKKDLKKAAKFYRMAEAKGISMVGNSWIYKDKYMDKAEAAASPQKAQARSRSRARSIFGRKKAQG